MSALVRITTGIMPQHSRVGMSRAMAQFGEASGTVMADIRLYIATSRHIPAFQDAADRAYAALKAGQVFVDGFPVGVGPAGGGGGKGGGPGAPGGARQRSPPRERRKRSPPGAARGAATGGLLVNSWPPQQAKEVGNASGGWMASTKDG
eukprot:Skav215948  [mRNA]  locus=scaffold226:800906:804586:+ [translate_table: standard]